MPKLGNTVESSVIVSWKVKPGDQVKKDTALCEIETDKATMDVPAGEEGTVLALLRKEGDDVPVLEPIAVIGVPGETWEESKEIKASPNVEDERSALVSSMVDSVSSPFTSARPSAKLTSPRARMAMSNLSVSSEMIGQGSGPQGRIIERDVIQASSYASSSALSTDSLSIEKTSSQPAIYQPSASRTANDFETVPLAGIRKRIAGRMRESLQTTAQYTEHCTADAERLLASRARFKNNTNPEIASITIGDLVLAAVVKLLAEFPEFNAHFEEGTLRLYKSIHLGVAVDTPRGLMVPVVKNADARNLTSLSKEVKRLAQACQNGTANPDELSGSTFTVTNLGAFGIEQFTPVINAPETAILGVCAIRPALTQTEKGIETRMRIGFSLTSDHQVIDGAYAARFLKRLSEAIADIDLMFMSL